jgi:Uma2 family endonuclease
MMAATDARRLFRFTVQDYEQLIDAGIFVGRGRVELLGGEIIEVPKMSVPHAKASVNIAYVLHRQAPPGCRVGSRLPILLDPESEPEPDLIVFHRRKRTTHPTPDDIHLLVEVSDTTVTRYVVTRLRP